MNHRKDNTNRTRALLLALCFLSAFLVSLAGIRRLAPEPYVPFFSERLSVLESQKDQVSLLFIGSSHYRSGIDPILFDRLTAEAGYPTSSLNFSLPNIHLPEIQHVLGRIRELRLAGLEWVVMEPRLKVHFTEANARKQRLIYYHDLPATLMALTTISHRPDPAEGRIDHYWRHLEHFGYRLTNQGLAHSLVTGLYHGNSPSRKNRLQQVVDLRGYQPRTGGTFTRARRERYEQKIENYSSNEHRANLDSDLARELSRLTREIAAMGARPIICFPPDTDSDYELVLPETDQPVHQIRLDDLERYPELFALENRWDLGHMNAEGAKLATTALADAFLDIANGKRLD